MKSIADIERDILVGDSISTPDLKRACDYYANLREALLDGGPRWHIPFGEANRLWLLTRSYLRGRGVKLED